MIKKAQPILRAFLALTLVLNPMAYAQQAGSAPKTAQAGDLVPGGHKSPEGNEVRYQGQQDAVGREKVYSGKGASASAGFREGVLESNGSIRWDGATRSRFPGQNTYPNYPAVKGTPIPRGQSLVPLGVPSDIPRPPGNSGINSPSVEILPEFAEANRPSQISRTIEMTQEKLEAWRRALADTMTAAKNSQGLKTLSQMSADALTKINGGEPGNLAGKAVGYSVGFLVALGLVAAYKVYWENPQNPAAGTEYLNSSVSAMGIATFAGFLLGSWVHLKIFGPAPGGGRWTLIPWFGSFLMFGAAFSTPIQVMGSHPDFVPCMRSFSTFFGKYNPTTDALACDRLQDWMFSDTSGRSLLRDSIEQFVPFSASLLSAAGVFLAGSKITSMIVNRSALYQTLRGAALNLKSSGRVGNLIVTAGIIVGVMGAFMFAQTISDSAFQAEKSVREFFTADKGLFSNTYGASIKSTEANLFKEWSRVKANGWKDPQSWEKICYDPKRDHPYYNCDAPDQLDMKGLLDRYSGLQSTWRNLQLADTLAAYQQWNLKVGQFNSTVGASYSLYRKAIEQVQQKGAIDLEELKKSLIEEWPQIASQNGPNVWKHVNTPTMFDFLLTSMACGPEIDGYNSTGSWFESTKQLLHSVVGNTSPDEIVENRKGFTAEFYPPRMTTPIPGTTDSICQNSPLYVQNPSSLAKYISQNIRANAESFDDWWADKVMTKIQPVQDQFQNDYYQMLKETFVPALTRRDYRWCQPATGDTAKNPTLHYLTLLTSTSEVCGPEGTSRLGYGILANNRDELRTYVAMLIELHLSNLPEKTKEAEDDIVSRANRLLMKYDEFLNQLSLSSPNARMDLNAISLAINQELAGLRDLLYRGTDLGAMTILHSPYQPLWIKALLDKINKNMSEAEAYLRIATAMDHLAKENIAKKGDGAG